MKKEQIKDLITHFNQLVKLDTDESIKTAPDSIDIIPPKYLSHCANIGHFYGIIQDQQFGGKEVMSGNVEGTFKATNFSPIPMLSYSGYDACFILKSKKIEKITKKKFYPSLYNVGGYDKESIYFDDTGWKKVHDDNRSGFFFRDEKEWRLKNPIPFDVISDTDAFLIRSKYKNRKSTIQDIHNYIVTMAVMQKKSLTEINDFRNKFYFVDWDSDKNELVYDDHIFDPEKPIKRIITCDKSFDKPMIDADDEVMNLFLKTTTKGRESMMMKGNCRYVDAEKNIEV